MKNSLLLILLLGITETIKAQCSANVPTYIIDLTATPDTTWVLSQADAQNRLGQCCGVPTNEDCISFEITLNENAAGIFFDYDGAPSYGSLHWRVDCGPEYNLRDTICVTDAGPFTLTFCKPGNDNGNYTLISIPRPTFPDDQIVPRNCIQPLEVLGVEANTVTWQSISPGAPGQYNNLLSCTDCLEPVFTPDQTIPSEIHYQVCGYPILDYCVGNFLYCDTVKFFIQDSLELSILPEQPSFCAGSSVQLSAQASGGDLTYNYIWYNSALQVVGTGPTFQASAGGTYLCEVRDGNYEPGFCDNFFESVNVIESLPTVVSGGSDQVLCANSPSANITASFQNSTGVVWGGGSGTFQNGINAPNNVYVPTANEINNGNVILTLTSVGAGSGCNSVSDQIQLFFTDTISTNLSDIALPCFNDDVSVNPLVSGGTAPFTYSWSNGINTLSNTLGDGSYCLTISDAMGCQVSKCIVVTEPQPLSVVLDPKPSDCNGSDNGTIGTTITGGTAPFSYNWSSGADSQNLTNLSPGTYNVLVEDNNGCQISASAQISEPVVLTATYSHENVTCNGYSDGSINVEIIGGISPYVYSWSNGSVDQDLDELPGGNYALVITDANGCSENIAVAVEQPDQLMINTISVSNYNGYGVSCNGMQNGELEANVIGGIQPYTFEWSNGSSTQSIFDLANGTYTVIIKDSNECSVIGSAEITQPDSLIVTINPSDVSCNGGADGWIDVTVTGGTPTYTYEWSTGQSSEDITTLSEGEYALTVSDANNCYYVVEQVVIDPNMLEIDEVVTNVSCFNLSDGSIDITCNGGTLPYTYQWSNGVLIEDISELPSGQYSAVVTDANGCWTQISMSIVQPDPVSINGNNVNPACNGESNGQIETFVSGGTSPYLFSWSNGSDQQNLNNLAAGEYNLSVTDANNCEYSQTFTLTQPSTLINSVNTPVYFHNNNISLYGESDGSIYVQAFGGTEPYSYTWSNGSNSQNQQNLSAGTYYLTIEDAQGCLKLDTIVLTQPSDLALPTIYTPNEDGDNDSFEIRGIEAYPDNEFIVVNRWGNVVYSEDKYHNTWKGTHLNGEELPDGVYFVILKINNEEIERNTYVHIKRY